MHSFKNQFSSIIGIIILTNFCIIITNGLTADTNTTITSNTIESSTVSLVETTDDANSLSRSLPTTSEENMIMSSTNNYNRRADNKKEQTPSRSKILDNIFNIPIQTLRAVGNLVQSIHRGFYMANESGKK